MIPIELEFQAFGPFNKKQTIDFTLFESDRLFLISGNTGSGKTTIFDAITFSLFGQASGSNRLKDSLKSDFADINTLCYVSFKFISQSKTYIVYREAIQKKLNKKNELSKKNATSSLLFEDGKSIIGTKNVDAEIESILGLDYEQFKKIVLLPQGEFSKFMFDKDSDKQATLRKIFDTSYIDVFSQKLKINADLIAKTVHDNTVTLNSIIKFIDYQDDEELKREIEHENKNFEVIIKLLKGLINKYKIYINQIKLDIDTFQSKINNIDIKYALSINQKFGSLSTLKKDFLKLELKCRNLNYLESFIKKLDCTNTLQSLKNNICDIKKLLDSHIVLTNELNEKLLNEQQFLLKISEKLDKSRNEILKVQNIQIEIAELNKIKLDFNNVKNLIKEQDDISVLINSSCKELSKLQKTKEKTELNNQITEKTELLKKHKNLSAYIIKLEDLSNDYIVKENEYQDYYNKFNNFQAFMISQNLKDDSPCPVCGSTHHPKKPQNTIENVSKDNLDSIKNQLDKIKKELDNKQNSCSILISELEIDGDIKFVKMTTLKCITKLEDEILVLNKKISGMSEFSIDDINVINTKVTEYKTIIQISEEKLKVLSDKISELKDNINLKNITDESINNKLIDLKNKITSIAQVNQEQEEIYNKSNISAHTIRAKLDTLQDQKIIYEKALHDKYLELQKSFIDFDITENEYEILEKKLEYKPNYQNKLNRYTSSYNEHKSLIDRLTDELSGLSPFDLDKLNLDKENYTKILNEKKSLYEHQISIQNSNIKTLNELTKNLSSNEELFQKANSYRYLSDIANGKNYTNNVSFERYVLSMFFEKIVENANIRLASMTFSRYTLNIRKEKEGHNKSSGLSLEVFDFYTGKSRHINTLSGGESFQIALSLSLGLADIISQNSSGIEINTMFIDEGFGTLDSDSIETALNTLIDMKDNGRYIGIISHVSELKEKISSKILVSSSNVGSSIKVQ